MSRRIAEGIGRVYVSPKNGGLNMVAFDEGDEVPDWAAEQMGDHCFDGLGGDQPDVDSEAEETPAADDAPADPATPETPDDEVDGNDDEQADEAETAAPDYEAMTIPVLKAEIDKRNEGRDADDEIEVEGAGNKPDLIAALVADDAAQSDTDN